MDAVWNNTKYAVPPTGNQEEDDKKKMDKIHNEQAKKYNAANGNLEKSFLQQFARYDISLYKADNNMSNWNKLAFNELENRVVSEPCN